MKLVIANLKMNLLFSDIKKYKSKLEDANLKDIIIAPSMLYLSYFSDSSINICSQWTELSLSLMTVRLTQSPKKHLRPTRAQEDFARSLKRF